MLPILLALPFFAFPQATAQPQLELNSGPDGLEVSVSYTGSEDLLLLVDRQPGPRQVGPFRLGLALSEDAFWLPLGPAKAGHVTRILPTPEGAAALGTWYLQVVAPRATTLSATLGLDFSGTSTSGQAGTRSSRLYFVDGALGNDSNQGNAAGPWLTIQHAANQVPPGSTVIIAAGIYQERVVVNVSGSATQGMIVFSGALGGGTVIDGSGFGPGSLGNWTGAFGLGLIDITDRSHIRFEHLEVSGLTTSSPNSFIMGVQVAKTEASAQPMDRIEFHDVNIHDITYTGTNDAGGAQGLALYGGSTTQAITNVDISDCEIHDLRLGQSEAVTLNGNIDGFVVSGCDIHDNDNIGLALIGWEGTAGGSLSDDDSDDNADLYGGHNPIDRARNGVVENNLVRRCSTDAPVKNPTYPANDFSAGGLYVDGGKTILIQGNFVYECDLGVEIGCEHGGLDDLGLERDTNSITCRSNVIYYCGQTGIGLGGYNAFRGTATGCTILNNTVYKCSSVSFGGGQILISKSHNNLIANNLLIARGLADTTDYDGYNNTGSNWRYDHGVVIGSAVAAPTTFGNSLDRNLYFTADGITNIYWKWEQGDNVDPVQGFGGLAAIDVNALFGDPLFVQATIGKSDGTEDFKLDSASSPAIDNGDSTQDIGPLDAGGLQRIAGSDVDRGAFEWNSTPPE